MKKIIILAIATLSTGIVLSSSLTKKEIVVKPVVVETQKNMQQKNESMKTIDVVSQGD